MKLEINGVDIEADHLDIIIKADTPLLLEKTINELRESMEVNNDNILTELSPFEYRSFDTKYCRGVKYQSI